MGGESSSSSSSSGSYSTSLLGGIASLTSAINSIINSYQMGEMTAKAQKEAMGLAYLQRSDALKQNNITNRLAQARQQLEQAGFGFSVMAANRSFAFEREKYRTEKERADRMEARGESQRQYQNLLTFINADESRKNTTLARFAA